MLRLKKFGIIVLAITLILSTVVAQAAYRPAFDIQAKAAYMVNVDTGEVMLEKNADLKLFPGYLAKFVNALVVLDEAEKQGWDIDKETAKMTVSIQNIIYGSSNVAGIYNGDELTLHDLLYAMLLQSANDAALMLAYKVGDKSEARFAELMNEKAKQLGCKNTNFTDSAGFPDDETYTTAEDFSLILKACLENEIISEIMSVYSHKADLVNESRSITFVNYTNAMIKSSSEYYYAPAIMSFVSNLNESGRCIVSAAQSDGYTYMMVLLGAPVTDTMLNYEESIRLFRWAFEDFTVKTVVKKGELIAEVPVKFSKGQDYVNLEADEDFMALMERSIDVTSVLYETDIPEFITAPVKKGEVIGKLNVMLADENIGSVNLLAVNDIKASGIKTVFGWIGNILHTFLAKFILVFAILIIAGYLFIRDMINKQRRRKASMRYRE